MSIDRSTIEAAYEAIRKHTDAGDWASWVACFSEDCRFQNSILPAPVEGRDALRALTAGWPMVVNRPEWVAIDGNRLVCGWNERQASQPESTPPYRGISTFVFDDDGLIREYEGIFDTAALVASMTPPG